MKPNLSVRNVPKQLAGKNFILLSCVIEISFPSLIIQLRVAIAASSVEISPL